MVTNQVFLIKSDKVEKCSSCNADLLCTADIDCWCNDFPNILQPDQKSATCLCSLCLINQLAEQVNMTEEKLSSSRLESIAMLGAVMEPKVGTDYYMEDGLLVMTKWYLARKGKCCGNGCRHCPY